MNDIFLIDVSSDVRYLNNKFFDATKHLGYNNESGTKLHEYQVDFAYRIDTLKYANIRSAKNIVASILQYIAMIPK